MQIDIEIGSEAWKEARRKYITATDAAIIMEGSDKEILNLYHRKTDGKELFVTSAMQRGTDLEPEARAYIKMRLGLDLEPEFHVSDKIPWIAANFDGICCNNLIEIKCPGLKAHDLVVRGSMPPKHYAQCQHQMLVADFKDMIYYSYNPDHETVLFEKIITRDNQFIDKMYLAEEVFYQHLQHRVPPECAIVDYDVSEELEAEAILLAQELRQLEDLKIMIEEHKELIKELSQQNSFSTYCLKAEKITKQGSIQYKKIPELQGLDLETYRSEPTEFWRFSMPQNGHSDMS